MAEPCTTKNDLISIWQEEADTYAKAVAELSVKIGVVSADHYHLLSKAAETARRRSQKAHDDLGRHIAEHGCGDMMHSQPANAADARHGSTT